jgi:hypothetical protein
VVTFLWEPVSATTWLKLCQESASSERFTPILGRSPEAGYVVRVVPTAVNTLVIWSTAQQEVGRQDVHPGQFQEIDTTDSTVPLLITCSKPCVVMQYNKGECALR